MHRRFVGKHVLVTGGSGGIGLATARKFVEEGATVFITGRRQQELDRAVAAIGAGASGIQGDVAKVAELKRLFAEIERLTAKLDVVVANA